MTAAKSRPSFLHEKCVHTVCACPGPSPDKAALRAMMKWDGEQGIALTGEVYAHYLWNYQSKGKLEKCYVEIYMPMNI